MNDLDLFLTGNKKCYSYEKYDHIYGLVAYNYTDRFNLIYEGDITDTLEYYTTLKFIGIFDTFTKIIYVVSDYYNTLYDNSEFEKILIHNIHNEMVTNINKAYNKYIEEQSDYLKKLAGDIATKFYNYQENIVSLNERAKKYFIYSTPVTENITFSLKVDINLKDMCNYIANKNKHIQDFINYKLNYDNEYRVSSEYSGIPDISCNLKQYIGFKLIEREKLQEIITDIENDNYENSYKFKKFRDIVNLKNINDTMKNVIIGFKYKNKSLEILYPINDLCRLYLSDYYVATTMRNDYTKFFEDLEWRDTDTKLMSIKYVKYRNKLIYEDENL